MKNKTLIYGALGLVAIGALIYLLGNDKDKQVEDVKSDDATPSKDGISNEQKTPDVNVEKAKDVSGKLTGLVGKSIYTKVDNVKVRDSAKVNNGIINNIYGELPVRNTLIGKVVSVVKDANYNWVGVKLSQEAYNMIQSQKNIVTRDLWVNIPPLKWVREDVIKLN
jgi:hypothetical protein